MVTSTFPSTSDDGTPAFVLDLAAGLSSVYDVTVVAPRTRASGGDGFEQLQVRRFPYFFRRFEGLADGAIMPNLHTSKWRWVEVIPFLAAMTWRTVAEVRRTPDTVISSHWIIPGGLAAFVASKVSGAPYIVTVHGADVHTLRGPLARTLKASILRHADRVMPVSTSVRDLVMSITPDLSDSVVEAPIPMGVPRLQPSPHERKTSEFLFVGRIVEKKGLDVAIRALAIASRASLRVIGDGPLESSMRDLAERMGVADRVRFLGRLSRVTVMEELSRCGGLLIPSVTAADGDEEGTPVVLAEGLTSGAPVIASAIGGLSEHVHDGHNGFLIPPGDHAALARLLDFAMDEPLQFQAAGLTAASEFSDGPLDTQTTISSYLRVLGEVHNLRGLPL